jgi:hypothetical protein
VGEYVKGLVDAAEAEYKAYVARLTNIEAAEQFYLASVKEYNDATVAMVDSIRANGGAFPDASFETNYEQVL